MTKRWSFATVADRPVVLQRQRLDLVVIDLAGFGVQAVLHRVVVLAGEIDLGTVGQVAAVSQAHAQDGVSGRTQRQVNGRVRLRRRSTSP